MSRKIDVRVVDGILYGVYKALNDVAGASAPAIMRRAAPDILNELNKLGVDFSCVDNVEKLEQKLGETMERTGMCDSMNFTLDGSNLEARIKNCAFFGLTTRLKEEGIKPFGCPFAALTIALAEKNLGKRARVKELHPSRAEIPATRGWWSSCSTSEGPPRGVPLLFAALVIARRRPEAAGRLIVLVERLAGGDVPEADLAGELVL